MEHSFFSLGETQKKNATKDEWCADCVSCREVTSVFGLFLKWHASSWTCVVKVVEYPLRLSSLATGRFRLHS